MVQLLTYLQDLDSSWIGIPPKQMVTTLPRILVQRLNIYLGRFVYEFKKIRKIMETLSEDNETTENYAGPSEDSNTDSEQNDEE